MGLRSKQVNAIEPFKPIEVEPLELEAPADWFEDAMGREEQIRAVALQAASRACFPHSAAQLTDDPSSLAEGVVNVAQVYERYVRGEF